MNRKVIIIIISVTVFFIAAYVSSNKNRKMLSAEIVGIETMFKLQSNEVVQKIDSNAFENYISTCKLNNAHLLLNKVIKGEGYLIYASMGAYNFVQSQIDTEKEHIISQQKREKINGETAFSYILADSLSFINRTIYSEIKDQNIIVFDLVSNDSAFICKAFDESYIAKHIIQ